MDLEDEAPDLVPLERTDMSHGEQQQPRSHSPEVVTGSVPITIVTGFLGSGKTTLIKSILTASHGKRIAVVLNEFGSAMNIERSALQHAATPSSADADDAWSGAVIEGWMELANGCLCCSVKDAGVKALENVLRLRGRFDYILLETTGLADPVPIVSMLWVEPALQSQLRLDGVVTVLDASRVVVRRSSDDKQSEAMEGQATPGADEVCWLMEDEACARQVAMADRILLNKRDLVTSERLAAVQAAVRRMNPSAWIHTTERSQVDVAWLLDVHAYDLHTPPVLPSSSLSRRRHDVLNAMTTVTLALPEFPSLVWSAMEAWLQDVLWEKHLPSGGADIRDTDDEVDVVRCKGMLFGVDGDEKRVCIVQGVGALYDREWIPIEHVVKQTEHISRIVFIGRKLNHFRMHASLVHALKTEKKMNDLDEK